MSLTVTELAEEALALPPEARAFLAEKLLESLDFQADFPVSDLWLQEITRRCAELDQGTIETVPAEIAIRRLRQSLE